MPFIIKGTGKNEGITIEFAPKLGERGILSCMISGLGAENCDKYSPSVMKSYKLVAAVECH
ncbi:hypothetical protein ES703_70182 [subsurface metagenome]